MSRKTGWFSGTVKPARPGVYECDWAEMDESGVEGGLWFNEWTGRAWRWGSTTPTRAKRNGEREIEFVPARWRGLCGPNVKWADRRWQCELV